MKKICLLLFWGICGILEVWGVDQEDMSGWKTNCLYGKVKSVNYDDGSFLVFNTTGNVVQVVNSEKYITVFDYINSHRYILQDEFYDIEIDGNVRKEVKEHSNGCIGTFYVFDKLGRVCKSVRTDYGDLEEVEYIYKGNEPLPWKIKESESWETGMSVQVSEICYLKTDSLGNWLEREVKYTTKEVNYEAADSTFITKKSRESCEITYFTAEELTRAKECSNDVKQFLVQTQDIGLQTTIPIIAGQNKGSLWWKYGLTGGGICFLIIGIVFYFRKRK